jgi:predicted RNA binding protein YcfA (HicA-like mRNA interferase family)
VLDRIHGSHHVMVKDGSAVPVPVHGKRDLGEDLIAALQQQTGVKLK